MAGNTCTSMAVCTGVGTVCTSLEKQLHTLPFHQLLGRTLPNKQLKVIPVSLVVGNNCTEYT